MKIFTVLLTAALVCGCSSSGDGGSSTASCKASDDWEAAWSSLEDEILVIVNEERAKGGSCGGESFAPSEPLVMNSALRCAARLHSLDMAEQDYFDHTSQDGRSPGDRMNDAGYTGFGSGENISAGRPSAAATMEGWMDSSGHCSNILNPNYREIGVGYYPGGSYGHLWTQTFGQ